MNNQNSILLIDPKFDPSTSVNCSLLVKIGIDSFSYAILNKEINKVVAVFDEQEVAQVSTKLSDRVKNDVYLGLSFDEVKVAVYTENSIAIPNEFFRGEDLNLSAKFFPQNNTGNVYTTPHSNFGFTSAFSISKQIDEIINQSFSSNKKYQQHTPLLKLAETFPDSSLFIDFTVRSIHLLYVAEKRLIFQQSYEIETSEEFNYYILLIGNQLSIDLNNTRVYLSGIIDQQEEKYLCLKKYFNIIHFLSLVDPNLDQQVLEDMPAHYYTTLLALDQCV